MKETDETNLYRAGKEYQEGAEYPDWVKEIEDAYVTERKLLHDFHQALRKLRLWSLDEPIREWSDFDDGITRGTWQAKYGFYREFKPEDLGRWLEPFDEES